MFRFNLQLFGGRGGGSRMSSSTSGGGSGAVQSVFGKSADTAARDYWDNLRIPAGEKYAQARGAAESLNGNVLSASTHVYDVIRTQAGDNNPDLLNGSGRNATWKPGYQDAINERLGESGQNALQSAIQRQAQAWLDRNPRPASPRKNGYKWDGTRYVRS